MARGSNWYNGGDLTNMSRDARQYMENLRDELKSMSKRRCLISTNPIVMFDFEEALYKDVPQMSWNMTSGSQSSDWPKTSRLWSLLSSTIKFYLNDTFGLLCTDIKDKFWDWRPLSLSAKRVIWTELRHVHTHTHQQKKNNTRSETTQWLDRREKV